MKRWQAMNIFVHVSRAGSFTEAARLLGMSPPAVARNVSMLETYIGKTLLIRATRPMRLTECGRQYFQDCERLLEDIERAEAAVKEVQTGLKGTSDV